MMNFKKFFQKYPWQVWLIIVAAVIVQLILFYYKEMIHADEFSSFGLANGDWEVLLYHTPESFDNHLFQGAQIEEQFMPKGNRFLRLWKNLPLDNHMPFYFYLLTSVSSFFSYHFTMAPAVILNVLILIATLFGFYLLANQLFSDKDVAVLSLMLFAFCQPVLSVEIYIRMYLLWMMLCIYFIYFSLKYIAKPTKRCAIGIFIFSLLQILTHYYGLIFGFIVCGAGSLILLCEKKYRTCFIFMVILASSAICSGLLYPAMFDVGRTGERGVQFFDMLEAIVFHPITVLGNQLPYFWRTVCYNGWILSFGIGLLLLALYLSHQQISQEKKHKIIFLLIVFLSYGFFSAMVQPDMGKYQIRYFVSVVPIMICLLVELVCLCGLRFKCSRKYLLFVLFALVVINGFYAGLKQDNPFYFRHTKESQRFDRIVKKADIWWAMGGGWTHSYYIHNFADKVASVDWMWVGDDFDHPDFLKFSDFEKIKGKYAYLLLPKTQQQFPQGAIEYVKQKTGRQAFYLFTLSEDKQNWAIAFEASVFLVAPY